MRLLYYGPRDLTFRDGKVTARVRPLTVRAVKGDHFTLGEALRLRPVARPMWC